MIILSLLNFLRLILSSSLMFIIFHFLTIAIDCAVFKFFALTIFFYAYFPLLKFQFHKVSLITLKSSSMAITPSLAFFKPCSNMV